jgi:hypothetical protein
VAADHPESDLMFALRPCVQLGKPSVGPVSAKTQSSVPGTREVGEFSDDDLAAVRRASKAGSKTVSARSIGRGFVLWSGSDLRQVHKSDIKRTTNVSRRHPPPFIDRAGHFHSLFSIIPAAADIFHCKRGNFFNKLQAHIFERSLLFVI